MAKKIKDKVKFKIKKGDNVIVITGKDVGKKGVVTRVITKTATLLISGINIVTKHQKPTMNNAGGILKIEAPIAISNVSHIDPASGKPTKIGFKFLENGEKVRFAKKSGEIIDNRN